MPAHRARDVSVFLYFLYVVNFLYFSYFFGLDSGGTMPLTR